MGVSVVCRVGPRVSCDFADDDRYRLREGATGAAGQRKAPASDWADSGGGVGIFGGEPAGAGVGGVARLQRGEARERRGGRSRVPGALLSQAAAEFHVVGEWEGQRRAQTF